MIPPGATPSIERCLRALHLCHAGDWADPEVSGALRTLYADLEGPVAADAAERVGHSPKDYESVLSWKDRLVHHLAQAHSSIEDWWPAVAAVEDPIIRMHLILEMIRRLAAEEKLDRCREYIEQLPDLEIFGRSDSTRARGFLVLLLHHAERGDIVAFDATLPGCEPAKNRGEIANARERLVARVAVAQGWEAALALTRKKGFGDALAFQALAPLARSMPYPDLRSLLDARPELSGPPFHTRLRILVEAFRLQSGRGFDRASFNELFGAVDAIDPKLKPGDYRLRDWLLCNLGSGCLGVNEARRCQKAISNPLLKRELGYHIERLTQPPP